MRQKGYLTHQRKVILDIVRESEDHPSAADVIDRLKEKGIHFAYGTIYNSLKYLTENGYIREIRAGDGVSRYDGRMEAHHHIRCRICNRIEEVYVPLPQPWLKQAEKETGYIVDDEGFLLEGVCPSCQEKLAIDNPAAKERVIHDALQQEGSFHKKEAEHTPG
ncbi:MAG: transcriptional repressor [Candidatus Carbobacillus sp.]|nr:transcriptional repressor [Candidatus Carbobacillus sp.]